VYLHDRPDAQTVPARHFKASLKPLSNPWT
jgi:hypothetical protein